MTASVILHFTLPLWSKAGISTRGPTLGSLSWQLKGQTPVNLGDILPNNHTWLPGLFPPKPPRSFWQLGHQQCARGWVEFSSWLLRALWCHFPWLTLDYGGWSLLHFQITWYPHERLWGRFYFKCYPFLRLPDANVRIGPRANQIPVLSPAGDRISSAYPGWKCTGSLPGTANVQHTNLSTLLCILTDFRNLWEFSLTLERKRSEEML